MTNLATKADLEDFTGSTVDDDRALFLLTAASDAARGWTSQVLSPVAADVVTLRGNDHVAINLPQWPVTALTEVLELAPGEDDVDGEVLVEEEDYYFTAGGVLKRIDGGVWIAGYRYKVTYDHGWTPIPADVRLAVCRMAGKLLSNPLAAGPVQSESIGDYSYTLAALTAGAVKSMTDEQALLAPYRSKGQA